MSEQAAASKKQCKKDTKIEKWAETKDPFINALYKKLRNSQKKLNQIKETEQKIKDKEIQPTQEQLDKISRKGQIQTEMDEVLDYLNLYKESFPQNPADAAGGKKKGAEEKVEVAAQSDAAVDLSKVVDDALSLVADSVIFATLNGNGVELKGSNQNFNDAIGHIAKAWSGLT
jgi:hypothetical protein